jgi:hypothetical protein
VWQGEPLQEKTILLRAEPDLEDTLQLVRYASLVKSKGAHVLLACSPAFAPALSECLGVDRLLQGDPESWPPFDVHATLASLPAIFQTRSDSIPSEVPYLRVAPERLSRWQERFADPAKLTVGLAWQLSPIGNADQPPLLPVEQFDCLAEVPGLRLVSLQLGDETKPEAALSDRLVVERLELDVGDDATMMRKMAAVIASLDLVITPDTALAHLAGALARRVWVALPHLPDWRWQLQRDDCPWYPTMRLFRQSTPGDWADVFETMKSALQQLVASTTSDGDHDTGEDA